MSKPGASGGWASTANMKTGAADIVRNQCDFDKSEYYTVQLGVEPPILGSSFNIFSCLATISFKVEGNFVTRVISVTNGVSISGTAQAININLQDNTPVLGQPLNQPYKVGMQVVPGTRPTQNRPPILVFLSQSDFTVAPTTTTTILIPNNAGVISMEFTGLTESTPNSAPNAVIQFFSPAQGFKSYLIDNTNYQGFIPVPPKIDPSTCDRDG